MTKTEEGILRMTHVLGLNDILIGKRERQTAEKLEELGFIRIEKVGSLWIAKPRRV